MYVLICECVYKNQTILLELLAGSSDTTASKDHLIILQQNRLTNIQDVCDILFKTEKFYLLMGESQNQPGSDDNIK